MDEPRLFVFGLGYTGARLATKVVDLGWPVTGTVRNLQAEGQNIPDSIRTVAFDSEGTTLQHALSDPQAAAALSEATHVLITMQPSDDGDPVVRDLTEWFSCNEIGRRSKLQWVGYLSTIGVYGDHQDEWIDENAELRAQNARSKRRMVAERQYLESGLPVHIFRLPGIYGPGRGPLQKVREGRARRLVKAGTHFNRIHVDDITETLFTSMRSKRTGATSGEIYNVVDDEPAPAHTVIEHACALLKQEPPPLQQYEEVKDDLSAMVRTFYQGSKRVLNTKIKKELGVVLKYPTYREGNVGQFREEQQEEQRLGKSSAVSLNRPTVGRLVLIVDNGSIRAAATLELRRICSSLQERLNCTSTSTSMLRVPVSTADNDIGAGAGAAGAQTSLCTTVIGVSARWSNRVDSDELGGAQHKALLLLPALLQFLRPSQDSESGGTGWNEIIVLPLFFGPSATVTQYMPDVLTIATKSATTSTITSNASYNGRRVAAAAAAAAAVATAAAGWGWMLCKDVTLVALLRLRHRTLQSRQQPRVTIGKWLVDVTDHTDVRIARIIVENVRAVVEREGLERRGTPPALLLVDHGTPALEVNRVREHIGKQVNQMLQVTTETADGGYGASREPLRVSFFSTCSMERREGAQYDFNEPMLENLVENGLSSDSVDTDGAPVDIIVAPLFLLPGKHAGPGGDIAEIIEAAIERCNGRCSTSAGGALPRQTLGKVFVAELVGAHPLLLQVIETRLKQVLLASS
jgi:nucleoside-diphosphate-sugar epimerase/sirohydrochlorin ferrochelatase